MAARWLPRRTLRSVVVHTTGGASLAGVLAGVYPDVLVLRHVRVLDAGGDQAPAVDGDVAVPRARVAWMQILEPGAS